MEQSGAVHLVVAGTDNEYFSWIRELRRASNVAIEASEVEGSNDFSNNSDSESRPEYSAAIEAEGNRSKRIVGRGITMAVQAAKATGQVAKATGQVATLVGRRRRLGTGGEDASESSTGDPTATTTTSSAAGPETQNRSRTLSAGSPFPARKLSEDANVTSFSAVDDEGSGTPRGLQVKNRFAGVGQATKSRFGSAFQAAKQKGREVTQKGKQVTVSTRARIGQGVASTRDFVEGRSAKREDNSNQGPGMSSWSCPECTFQNSYSSAICDVCGSPPPETCMDDSETDKFSKTSMTEEAESTVPEEDDSIRQDASDSNQVETVAAETDASFQRDGVTTDFALEREQEKQESAVFDDDDAASSDEDELEPRRSVTQRFGAAVRSVRRPETRSGGFSMRRPGNQGFPDGSPDPIKLRNVKLSGSLPTTPHPIHGGAQEVPKMPSKRLEGLWTVAVLVDRTEADATSTTGPGVSLVTIPEKNDSHENQAKDDLEGGRPLSTADQSADRKLSEEQTNIQPEIAEPKQPLRLETVFTISVSHRSMQDSALAKSSVSRTYADVLDLHRKVSQSLTQDISSLFLNGEERRSKRGELGTVASTYFGLSPLDTIRMSARLLSGLLDADASLDSAPYRSYCGKLMQCIIVFRCWIETDTAFS